MLFSLYGKVSISGEDGPMETKIFQAQGNKSNKLDENMIGLILFLNIPVPMTPLGKRMTIESNKIKP